MVSAQFEAALKGDPELTAKYTGQKKDVERKNAEC